MGAAAAATAGSQFLFRDVKLGRVRQQSDGTFPGNRKSSKRDFGEVRFGFEFGFVSFRLFRGKKPETNFRFSDSDLNCVVVVVVVVVVYPFFVARMPSLVFKHVNWASSIVSSYKCSRFKSNFYKSGGMFTGVIETVLTQTPAPLTNKTEQ